MCAYVDVKGNLQLILRLLLLFVLSKLYQENQSEATSRYFPNYSLISFRVTFKILVLQGLSAFITNLAYFLSRIISEFHGMDPVINLYLLSTYGVFVIVSGTGCTVM